MLTPLALLPSREASGDSFYAHCGDVDAGPQMVAIADDEVHVWRAELDRPGEQERIEGLLAPASTCSRVLPVRAQPALVDDWLPECWSVLAMVAHAPLGSWLAWPSGSRWR